MSGELIYLSERKLRNAARELGIRSPRSRRVAIDASVGVSVPVAPGADVSAAVTGHLAPPAKSPDEDLHEMLEDVVASLERSGLPDLDAGDDTPDVGEWFRFHRDLIFGVGASDDDQSIRALVLVDQRRLDDGGVVPGLLMHGAVVHVLDPYRPDDAETLPGARSGSGTGTLFIWAKRMSAMLDEAVATRLDDRQAALLDDRPRRAAESAIDMYRLFSDKDWMSCLPQLAHPAPCEGIARATFVAVDGERTVVMATPLYVRMAAQPNRDEPAERVDEPRAGLLARLRRRR